MGSMASNNPSVASVATEEGQESREGGKHMVCKTSFAVSALALGIAMSCWSSGPAVSGGSSMQKEGAARYLPVQSISYEFGSKAMSGYYLQQGSVCLVTLMIVEKGDLDQPSPSSATRIRLML